MDGPCSHQDDILQQWWNLNSQLHPWSLSEFASWNNCRIHNTGGHDEMRCLTFLSRMELALQGKISFSKLYEPFEPSKANLSLQLVKVSSS